jgi:hypothetical protein
MSAPRTLRELRAAVARVLVARGEAADALVCSAYTFGGGTTAHIDAVACNTIVPWIDVHRARRRDAIAGAWQALVTDLHAEHEAAKRACAATRRPARKAAASSRYAKARAALAAAREAGE